MTTTAGVPDRRCDLNLILGAADAQRGIVWYDTYAPSIRPEIRAVIRRAVDRAT